MYNVIFDLLNLLVFKLYLSHALFSCTVKLVLCAPPPPPPNDESGPSLPTNEGPGIIGQAGYRTQKLSGGDSVRKLTLKCDMHGWNTVNQRSIHHQFNRTGKLHGSWGTLQVFWGRARFHGSTVLFWMALVLNTVYTRLQGRGRVAPNHTTAQKLWCSIYNTPFNPQVFCLRLCTVYTRHYVTLLRCIPSFIQELKTLLN
jgi:hypothetical protein